MTAVTTMGIGSYLPEDSRGLWAGPKGPVGLQACIESEICIKSDH